MDGIGGRQILKGLCGDDKYHLLKFLKVISTTTVSLETQIHTSWNRAWTKSDVNGINGMKFFPHWLETEHWQRPKVCRNNEINFYTSTIWRAMDAYIH